MFGMSGTELAIVLILALLLLGPQKLPELARALGKGLRDFRKVTDDVRTTVESEFYRLDQPPPTKPSQTLPSPTALEGVAEATPSSTAASVPASDLGTPTPSGPAPSPEAIARRPSTPGAEAAGANGPQAEPTSTTASPPAVAASAAGSHGEA